MLDSNPSGEDSWTRRKPNHAQVATTQVATTQVATTHVAMTHVAMTHVAMTQVATTHVAMTHVAMTTRDAKVESPAVAQAAATRSERAASIRCPVDCQRASIPRFARRRAGARATA